MIIPADSYLTCPSCKNENLHQEQVDVYDRAEDDDACQHVAIKGVDVDPRVSASHRKPTIAIDTELRGNPSSRRSGLTIRFWCETCDKRTVLSISQHKGSTEIECEEESVHEERMRQMYPANRPT